MSQLNYLIEGLELSPEQSGTEAEIIDIQFDSRKVREGSFFVAIHGLKTDGHQYIGAALEKGAHAILAEFIPEDIKLTDFPKVSFYKSANSARSLGKLAANFYQHPSRTIKVVGVTGTNGKTTTATLLFRLFRQLGYNVGLISTVQNQINDEIIPTLYTTPDAIQIQELLAEMNKKSCAFCFMEVSSHALVQERTAGIEFTGAIFTNISHDHLDFHGNFNNYIKAKKKFFDELLPSAFALVNLDDKRGPVMLQNCPARVQKTYGLHNYADFKTRIIENTLQGLLLEIEQNEIWFRLIGHFNAYNLMAVYASACLLGEEEVSILTELSSLASAAGRFEQFVSPDGITGIVDYAHTPDALKNVLETIVQIRESHQNIYTVVGCGGDRDQEKRPLMARLAYDFSNQAIFTSDNPRSEDPFQILEEMKEGLSPEAQTEVLIIENRQEAIARACRLAKTGDIILIAGKGHETYQEIQGERFPFDDREMLKTYLNIED